MRIPPNANHIQKVSEEIHFIHDLQKCVESNTDDQYGLVLFLILYINVGFQAIFLLCCVVFVYFWLFFCLLLFMLVVLMAYILNSN